MHPDFWFLISSPQQHVVPLWWFVAQGQSEARCLRWVALSDTCTNPSIYEEGDT
jgi:hypothetical protein